MTAPERASTVILESAGITSTLEAGPSRVVMFLGEKRRVAAAPSKKKKKGQRGRRENGGDTDSFAASLFPQLCQRRPSIPPSISPVEGDFFSGTIFFFFKGRGRFFALVR